MEEEKKLYPLRFCSLLDTYSWGDDEFKLADLGYRDSLIHDGWLGGNSIGEIMDMYCDRVVGEHVFNFYGRQFPIQIKYIHCHGKMPLIVHPDETTAQDRYDFLGREKLWYIVSAGAGAGLYLGFAKECDAAAMYSGCLEGNIDGMLNAVSVKAGDCFRIKPGTVHAAYGEVTIAEVSESSPLDFCLCGWGQEISEEEFDPSLGLVDALDFINYVPVTADDFRIGHHCHCDEHEHHDGECGCGHHHHDEIIEHLVQLPEFTVNRINLTDALHIYSEKFESFLAYVCLSGKACVQTTIDGIVCNYDIKPGEVILVPEDVPDFLLIPADSGTTLLETYVEKREDADEYINPDVPATLPGEEDDDDCCCEDDAEDCTCGHDHDHCTCGHDHKHFS